MNEFTHHLKNPPKRIFAYMHSEPGNSLMGVAISAATGKILEAVILPTKQRVMLGLGIGNDTSQAHVTYRRYGGKCGYELLWIEDPENDIRMNPLKKKKIEEMQEVAVRPIEKAIEKEINIVDELTAQLVKSSVEGFF